MVSSKTVGSEDSGFELSAETQLRPNEVCPVCDTELSTGGGHGYHGMAFRYAYCDKCDKFPKWESTLTGEKENLNLQNFCRSLFSKEIGEGASLSP